MPRAWFIDATKRTISAVEVAHGSAMLVDMRRLIGGYIDIAHVWPGGDVLYVDDEGLLKAPTVGFRFALRLDDQPLAGSGVVVGREIEGGAAAHHPGGYTTADPRIILAQLVPLVTFVRFIPKPFECPRCGAVSANPRDIAEHYCARCHVFADDP
jgi:hypothetical protein